MAERANYLGLDRPDIQFAVKEACRGMAGPKVKHERMLKRLARYLNGRPMMIMENQWQGRVEVSEGYGDSDWAGCRETRKSTSGGCLLMGATYSSRGAAQKISSQ